jgi:hypothetical protein
MEVYICIYINIGIGDLGAEALAGALMNNESLVMLDLTANGIGIIAILLA